MTGASLPHKPGPNGASRRGTAQSQGRDGPHSPPHARRGPEAPRSAVFPFGSHSRNKSASAFGSAPPDDGSVTTHATQWHRTKRDPYDPHQRAIRDLCRRRLADSHRRCNRPARVEAVSRCERAEWAYDNQTPCAPLLHLETLEPLKQVWHCKDRLCMWCCRARSAELCERIEHAIEERFTLAKVPVMMTFDLDDTIGESLQSAEKRLTDALARLRRMKRWKALVAGGVMSIEVTRNRERGSWHVHAHVLADVHWYEQEDLLRDWRTALYGADVVQLWGELSDPESDSGMRALTLQLLRDAGAPMSESGGARIERKRKTLKEALKYVVKGLEATQRFSDHEMDELTTWMHGRRLVRTFGNLYDLELPQDDVERVVDADELEHHTHAVNALTGELRPLEDAQWVPDGKEPADLARRYAQAMRNGRAVRLVLRPPGGPPGATNMDVEAIQ